MAMTDDQFERFMGAITDRLADHDLLVRVETIVKLNSESNVQFREQIMTKQEITAKSISAAHRRIDWLMVGGFVTILSGVISVAAFFLKA